MSSPDSVLTWSSARRQCGEIGLQCQCEEARRAELRGDSPSSRRICLEVMYRKEETVLLSRFKGRFPAIHEVYT
jgi:hypothetical protein